MGHSYNALYVPLLQWGWQCALMPASEVKADGSFEWSSSFEERKKKRKERKKQIEQDKADFHRLFRVDIDPREAATSSEFRHYADFIRNTLRASGRDMPIDGDGITRVLRNAVRDGRIIPVINRAWYGGQRVFKHYAPQYWRRDGGGVSLATSSGGANAPTSRFTGPFAAAMHAADTVMNGRLASSSRAFSGGASGSGGGFDWFAAAEALAGATLGEVATGNDGGGDSMLKSFRDGNGGSLLGDAQPFEYQPDILDGDSDSLAGMPIKGGPPNTWVVNPSGSGQLRLYDGRGNAAVDIDFDHDHGFSAPHSHNWEGKNRDLGNPVSLLP